MTYRKKLIEVSLPLEAINRESTRENYIYRGNPSAIHKWWAQRPLAACRAVLWASLVDDPSEYIQDETLANRERERLFSILEKLVVWENGSNEEIMDAAKLEIARSVASDLGLNVPVGKQAIREFLATNAPSVLDPFAGGGSIPLEAQRLGMRAFAFDLNPVAVLINKALIEIPPMFAGQPPINIPETSVSFENRKKSKKGDGQPSLLKKEWKGAEGLAEDVRFYGKWIRSEAEKRIGNLYPRLKISSDMLVNRPDLVAQGIKSGDELFVIAWLWARSVKCPNPACGAYIPLVSTLCLSKKGRESVWLDPYIDHSKHPRSVNFRITRGNGDISKTPKIGRGAQFRCLACDQIALENSIKVEFTSKRSENQLLSIVAIVNHTGKRVYLPAVESHDTIAKSIKPEWQPDTEIHANPRHMTPSLYGINTFAEMFTPRQLEVMNVFSALLQDVRVIIRKDAVFLGELSEQYANAVITYLAFAIDKYAMYGCNLVPWYAKEDRPSMLFSRQAFPMVWDFVEINPFSEIGGSISKALEIIADSLTGLTEGIAGIVGQQNVATSQFPENILISTDPPYFDNVPYADLSDFFYIWLRRSLSSVYPDLFKTLFVPKSDELVADSFRHGSKVAAEEHFINGIRKAFKSFRTVSNPTYPISIYYAFKQSESEQPSVDDSDINLVSSTGWEVMLQGLVDAGLSITGTWPMRTERSGRMRDTGSNALASSIVMVCRSRADDAIPISRRNFIIILKQELPKALRKLQQGNIAPVDLAQASIGPGMAIFSRYQAVLEANGTPMSIRAALTLINQALDEYLAEQEGEYDGDTRWALAWFEQYGHELGPYGVAETLSKAKNTSVEGLSNAGFLEARAGKVRLLKRDELDEDWDPSKDKRLTAWEAAQYLIRSLDRKGEKGAGALLSKLGSFGEIARDLAYRLYTICERKGWAQEALAYNMLVVAWPRIKEQSGKGPRQESLL